MFLSNILPPKASFSSNFILNSFSYFLIMLSCLTVAIAIEIPVLLPLAVLPALCKYSLTFKGRSKWNIWVTPSTSRPLAVTSEETRIFIFPFLKLSIASFLSSLEMCPFIAKQSLLWKLSFAVVISISSLLFTNTIAFSGFAATIIFLKVSNLSLLSQTKSMCSIFGFISAFSSDFIITGSFISLSHVSRVSGFIEAEKTRS